MSKIIRMSDTGLAVRHLVLGGSGQGETDASLADAIRECAQDDRDVLAEALRSLPSSGRLSYQSDRARRVLTALVEDRDIEPPGPDVRELYAEEQNLAELPRAEGLEVLVRREPRLSGVIASLVQEVNTHQIRKDRYQELRFRSGCVDRLCEIVGPDGASPDKLVSSSIAQLVAVQAFNEMVGWGTK